MNYLLICGEVTHLKITKCYQGLSPVGGAESGLAAAGVIATVLESSTSAAILAGSSAETSMNFFTCKVDGKILVGKFYQVGFAEGEKMEFVVAEADGVYQVHGAYSPQQNLIWTLPYRTRGNIAQRSSDIIRSIAISLFATLAFLLLIASKYDISEMGRQVYFSQGIISFLILLILNALVRRHFYVFL